MKIFQSGSSQNSKIYRLCVCVCVCVLKRTAGVDALKTWVLNTCSKKKTKNPLFPSLSLFSRAHLLPLSWPICLHRLVVSLPLHIASRLLVSPFPEPRGDTFYIFSAYPYFSAVTEFLSLDHHGSLSFSRSLSLSLTVRICVCECVCHRFLAHGWDGCTRGREGERAAPNYVSTLGLRVSLAFSLFLCTTVKCYWSISQALCLQQHTDKGSFVCLCVCVCVCVCVGMKYEKSQSQRLGGECADCGKLKTEYCNARSHTRRCDLNKKKQIGRSASLSRSASSNNRCGWANTRTHKHPHTRAVTPLTTPITEVVGVLINCGLRCYQRPQQQSRLKTDRVHRLSGQRGRRRKGREG